MKLKEVFYYLGFKPKPREYTFDIETLPWRESDTIQFARWRHPKETRKQVTPAQVDALRRFLRDGDVAIDIGAHTGDTSVPMALAVGRQGTVFALEPNQYVYKVLLANCALNPTKTHIVPCMFAVTESDGEFEFEYSDPGFCNGGMHEGIGRLKHAHFFKLKVHGRNLTKYLESEYPELIDKLRFIKIDTEGFDHQIVKSLRPLLERCRPYIRSEIFRHTDEPSRLAYYETLRSLGYRVYHMESDENYRGQLMEPADMTRWDHYDIFAVHDMNA